MTRTQRRLRARLRELEPEGESGSALVMVIGISLVLLILIATAVSFSLSVVVKASNDQNWNAAMSAAYAGAEEYESRIANDNTYLQHGNPLAPFSASSSVTLPPEVNPAFGIGASGTWATVQGSDDKASYRYEVDTSQYASAGTLRLRSTGRVGNETRSIVVNLKQKGFIDFLYFTDYEVKDPGTDPQDIAACEKYAWAGRSSSRCNEIAFGSNDQINGPMHSNDTIRICDATFNGLVTTAYNPTSGVRYSKKDSNGDNCSGQNFPMGAPTYSPKVGMPSTNAAMKQEVRSDLPLSVVASPGCLYTGPTSIVYNSDGTMTIRSPWTKATRVAGEVPVSGSQPTECGTLAALKSASGATISVLDNNLIYVQNVPTRVGDPNTPTPGNYPTGVTPAITASTCTAGNSIGYPMSGEWVSDPTQSYGCKNGDAFVSGTVKGRMTVAAENYLYVTGDVKYADSQTDVLGLVGQNSVWVWNPVKRTVSGGSTSYSALQANDRRIDAAILSVAHTFQVQNYNIGGSQGTLTINGAISQKFRGIVRGSGNGYIKNYVYDQRFRYIAPPKFLSPVSTSYGVSVLVEVADAFKADGTAVPTP